MAIRHSERGLDRLVNFSDAAVAIAITILILPLVDVAAEIADKPLGEMLAENTGLLLAFIVSFAVIGRYWMLHHRLFELVADYSSALIWLNLLWLASIVFLPFAANLLAYISEPQPAVYGLYIGTILLTSLTSVFIEMWLHSHPKLVVNEDVDSLEVLGGVIATALIAVALVVAVILPVINMWALLLLLLSGPIETVVRRIRPAPGGKPSAP